MFDQICLEETETTAIALSYSKATPRNKCSRSVMAGLVPAIHVVQLTKQQRFATISQLRSIEL